MNEQHSRQGQRIMHITDARRIGARAVFGMLLAMGLLALGSLTQPAAAIPDCDVPDPPPICDRDEEPDPDPDPVPPALSPHLHFDLARQTTERNAIHIAGWTADDDSPLNPLTVRISIDGSDAKTLTADVPRPDVAAAFPRFGSVHGYDVVIPASSTAQEVCVTAVNVGSGADSKMCQRVDDVVGFDANGISYDTANATISATNLDQLDKVTNTNKTTVQQSTTLSGTRVVTDTRGWSDTVGLTVTASAAVKIPIIDLNTNITVAGSASFTQNGSSSEARTFTWQQPVLVPAKSQVVATVAVTRSTLVVPYTMSGAFVYRSGAREPGSISGTYSGINSHDLEIKIAQFNLDGTPAARPVDQPEATRLEGT